MALSITKTEWFLAGAPIPGGRGGGAAAGRPVPGVAPAAKQMGAHVAATIRARLAGRTTAPFRYRGYGNLATIGRRAAVVDLRGLRFSGFPAWAFWLAAHGLSTLAIDRDADKIEAIRRTAEERHLPLRAEVVDLESNTAVASGFSRIAVDVGPGHAADRDHLGTHGRRAGAQRRGR